MTFGGLLWSPAGLRQAARSARICETCLLDRMIRSSLYTPSNRQGHLQECRQNDVIKEDMLNAYSMIHSLSLINSWNKSLLYFFDTLTSKSWTPYVKKKSTYQRWKIIVFFSHDNCAHHANHKKVKHRWNITFIIVNITKTEGIKMPFFTSITQRWLNMKNDTQ